MDSLTHSVYNIGLENKKLTVGNDIFKFLQYAVTASVCLVTWVPEGVRADPLLGEGRSDSRAPGECELPAVVSLPIPSSSSIWKEC